VTVPDRTRFVKTEEKNLMARLKQQKSGGERDGLMSGEEERRAGFLPFLHKRGGGAGQVVVKKQIEEFREGTESTGRKKK